MSPVSKTRHADTSLQWLAIGLLFCFGILAGGLWYVQILSFKKYEKYREVQSYRTVRVPAPRGLIFDRNSVVLADNEPQFNIVVYLDQLRDQFLETYYELKGDRKLSYEEQLELGADARYLTVSNLVDQAGVLINEPVRKLKRKAFEDHYKQYRYVAMPVLLNLSREQMARFMEQGSRLHGFDLEVRSKRKYPHGTTAAHVLGYMRKRNRVSSENAPTLQMSFDYELPDIKGQAGLEGQFETELAGEPGAKSILVNNLIYRQEEEEWLPSLPGKNLYLTLDTRIQKSAEKALTHYDPNIRGAIVVMDCTNGDVLAMASAPTFDPNIFNRSLSHAMSDWLFDDEGPLPLFNRATFGRYHPGSIFKIMVGLAGLEQNIIDPSDKFLSLGYFPLGKRRIDDTAGPGYFDFERALAKSSNPYFIHYGLEMGPEVILDFSRQIFLGEKTGLLTNQETGGYLPALQDLKRGWYDGDTANLSIGQGKIDVTPLQMAVMTSAVANGGTVYWPRVVAGLETMDPVGGKIFEREPVGRVRGRLKVSQDALQVVQRAMLADVQTLDGTGRICKIDGYLVGGKTGTAETNQKVKGGRMIKHTWFVSYAPFDNPRYAVVVFVEDGMSGGASCAPLAEKVYQTLKDLPDPEPVKPQRKQMTLTGYERAL
jgi:penicillin-binding protein 2